MIKTGVQITMEFLKVTGRRKCSKFKLKIQKLNKDCKCKAPSITTVNVEKINIDNKQSIDFNNSKESLNVSLPAIESVKFNTIEVERSSALGGDSSSIDQETNTTSQMDKRQMLEQFKKMIPLKVFGKKLIENNRKVLWRQDVMIGQSIQKEDSLIEISKYKNKFYIVQYVHNYNKFNVIEMFKFQGQKLLAACDFSFEKLINQLDMKHGQLIVSDYQELMNNANTVSKSHLNPLYNDRPKIAQIFKTKNVLNSSLEFTSNQSNTTMNSPINSPDLQTFQVLQPLTAKENKSVIYRQNQRSPRLFQMNKQKASLSNRTQLLKKIVKEEIVEVKMKVPEFEFINELKLESQNIKLPTMSKILNNQYVSENKRYGNLLTASSNNKHENLETLRRPDSQLMLTSVYEEDNLTDNSRFDEQEMRQIQFDSNQKQRVIQNQFNLESIDNNTQQNPQSMLNKPKSRDQHDLFAGSSEHSFYVEQDFTTYQVL
eukprot:403331004